MTRKQITAIKNRILKEFASDDRTLSEFTNTDILEIIECFEKEEEKWARLRLELTAALEVLLNVFRFHNPFESEEIHKKVMDKYAALYRKVTIRRISPPLDSDQE